jgi:hypothetical protein
LDSSLDDVLREEWSKQENLAITLRGDYLKVYEVQVDKGESNQGVFVLVLFFILINPVAHLPKGTLTTPKIKSDPKSASWLQHGLNVEQKQYESCSLCFIPAEILS